MLERSRSKSARSRSGLSRLFASLLKRIPGCVSAYLAGLRRATGCRAVPEYSRTEFHFESLEARVLLSADPVAGSLFSERLICGGVTDITEWSAVPVVSAYLIHDTGSSANDGLTRIGDIGGSITGRAVGLYAVLDPHSGGASSDLSVDLGHNGNFSVTSTQLAALAGGVLADGAHTLRLFSLDAAGNRSAFVDLQFTLDTTAPPIRSVGFSGADSTNHDGTKTAAAISQLKGMGEAGATITITGHGNGATTAAANGTFVLPGTRLELGTNVLNLIATDAAGNQTTFSTSLVRTIQQQRDAVLVWNDLALAAIKLDASDPAIAARVLAIQSLAVYDTLAAIEGTPAYLVQRAASAATSVEAAVIEAAYQVLYALYPGQRVSFDTTRAATLARITDGTGKSAGIELGKSIAQSVLAIRAADGYLDFATEWGNERAGQWRPTGPVFLAAQDPQWGAVSPFALSSGDQFRPAAPVGLNSAAYASALSEVRSLGGDTSTARTGDQTQQVHFWADGGGSVTPPGHWNQIASQIAAEQGNSLSANARLMAELNIALADAAIATWDTKYAYNGWRPVTAIQEADRDGNPLTAVDATWLPLLITPPHPEYVSGHSTFSAAAAAILAANFGDATPFSTTSSTLPGVTRSFTSFTGAAAEAGRSRVYGGIHFEFSNQAGQVLGKQVAGDVLARFSLREDKQAPTVVLGQSAAATRANLTLTGQVLDNLSGVASAEVRIDGGAPIALDFDAEGKFSTTTAFALDGSQDGGHTVIITARDQAGNLSANIARRLTLDTGLPTLSLTSLVDGVLSADSFLTGVANATGSSLVGLSYSIDGGASKTLRFDPLSGAFDEALPLGELGIGEHLLAIEARDAAGNLASLTRTVTLANPAPFTITKVTPVRDELEVGVTYRPQVFFSRAVDTSTLAADTFFATGPDGRKLAATIVPAKDGSYAWLFFRDPLPASAQVTMHLDGAAVRARSDGAALRINDNGSIRSDIAWSFITTGTVGVAGTRLAGRIVDPGPDLEPLTFDDIRRGPDGIIHTSDDVFLNPLAHVQVSILGRPDLVTFTDESGNFTFADVPAGATKVVVDGRPATNAPAGVFFPEMVMALDLLPGVANTMMGTMGITVSQLAHRTRGEVYLPRVQQASLQAVSATVPTTVTTGSTSAPQLTDAQRASLTLTVAPGSAVGLDGMPVADVQIGINTVPIALIKDMLPPGMDQPAFTITIQAPGVTAFTEPLAITFPNIFNAAPGTKLDIFSFDHASGMMVINGSGTVSADGATVSSDPGTGIMAPGWHGASPTGGCAADGSAPINSTSKDDVETLPPTTLDLIHGEGANFAASIGTPLKWTAPSGENASSPLDLASLLCPTGPTGIESLKVTIKVDGPLGEFLKQTGDVDLAGESFTLRAGSKQSRAMTFDAKTLLEMGGMKNIENNVLFAATIKITELSTFKDGTTKTTIREVFVSRYVDATDDKHDDATTTFSNTLADGTGNASRGVLLAVRRGSVVPVIETGSAGFKYDPAAHQIRFDPRLAGSSNGTLAIRNPNGDTTAGTVTLAGHGTEPQQIHISTAAIAAILKGIHESWHSPDLRALIDTDERRAALADRIVHAAINKFNVVAPGVQYSFGASPSSKAVEVVFQQQPNDGNPDVVGKAISGLDNYADIISILTTRSQYSLAEGIFRLDAAINKVPQGQVDIYPTVDLAYAITAGMDGSELVSRWSTTIAHEVGHVLGLVHTTPNGIGVKVGGMDGSDDIMAARTSEQQRAGSFSVTLNALRMATNLDYTNSQAVNAFLYYLKSLSGTSTHLTGEGQIDSDENRPLYAGPLTALRDRTDSMVTGPIDLGIANIGGGAKSVPYLITNFGNKPLVINEASVSGAGFSVAGIAPGTTILPGASLALSLTYTPPASGPATGELTLRSNDAHARTSYALSAFGQSSGPHATVVLDNNNFGGTDLLAGESQRRTLSIRNDGAQSLVLAGLAVSAGADAFSLGAAALALANAPVELAFGESYDVELVFAAARPGLQRGVVTLVSNDPLQQRIDVAVVGTGFAGSHNFSWGDDYVAVEAGGGVQRADSDRDGHFSFFLRAQAEYRTTVFDPATGMVAHGHGTTPASGRGTDLSSGLVFAPSEAHDSDGDGLPDDIELAIGSSPAKRDSNHDGTDDFSAVTQGGNPLRGLERRFTIEARALSGTPANPNEASANPGQTIILHGTNFAPDMLVMFQLIDQTGLQRLIQSPVKSVAADGTRALAMVPTSANGAFTVRLADSSSAPVLQIVPILTAFGRQDAGILSGTGFVENGTTYRFAGHTVDDSVADDTVIVRGLNNEVQFPSSSPFHHGAGALTVTTAGGTSASLQIDQVRVETVAGFLGGMAIDPVSGSVWAAISGLQRQLVQVDPADGRALRTIALDPVAGSHLRSFQTGLQISTTPLTLGAILVPAGSLLVFDGQASAARVLAFDPATGARFASLALAGTADPGNGVFDSVTGHFFFANNRDQASRLTEYSAATGELVGTYTLPGGMHGASALALDPVSGNLWMAMAGATGQLVEMTRGGAEVRRVDVSSQGVYRDIVGIAFRPDGTMWLASAAGDALRPVVIGRDTAATRPPTLTSLLAQPTSGVPANAHAAAANAGDILELRGTGFDGGTFIMFPVRDGHGKVSIKSVRPDVISPDGTRMQVRVPELATTGNVHVGNRGVLLLNGHVVPTEGEYSLHRQLSVNFTPHAATATLRFANGMLEGATGNKWGLDNVEIRQGTSVVFSDNFESDASAAWSDSQIDTSEPALFTRYSGAFGSDAGQALTLQGLTAGQTYTLSFDLVQRDADRRPSVTELFDVSLDGTSIMGTPPAASAGLRLQIVPTIRSAELTTDDGTRSLFLEGSGFMAGASTLSIGSFVISDTFTDDDSWIDSVANVGIEVNGLHVLDGPVRITTEGGHAEIMPVRAAQAAVGFTGIIANTADPVSPSASAGQTITLTGTGLTTASLVQFQATDDGGASGVVTRRGSPGAGGTTLTVTVPALARSGPVTVLGSGVSINLQVVPQVRGVGGDVVAGNTIVIDGSGLNAPDLAVRIDGIAADVRTRRTVSDSDGYTQQLITVTVPVGVSAGAITIGRLSLSAATHLTDIMAAAASGAAAHASIASANAGQVIALRGAGLVEGDKVVFTAMDQDGAFGQTIVEPDAFDMDTQTITVTVPQAAMTGAVRIARDAGGLLLQIVPTVSGLVADDWQRGSRLVALHGTGIGPVAGILFGAGEPFLRYNGTPGSNSRIYGERATGPIRIATPGGTSAPLSVTLEAITARALSGSAAPDNVPSANVGQSITLAGSGLTLETGIVFEVIDRDGRRDTVMVRPATAHADGTAVTVSVPEGAMSGQVRVMGGASALAMHIVPVITGVEVRSVSADGGSAVIRISGTGFVEGNASQYRMGDTVQVDSGPGGAEVNGTGAAVDVTVSLTDGAFGAITVQTGSATSAAYVRDIASIVALATTGTAADPARPSANPGQTITLRGSGLSITSEILMRWVDVAGWVKVVIVKPSGAASDGGSASLDVPSNATGAVTLSLFGSISQPLLQIVPIA